VEEFSASAFIEQLARLSPDALARVLAISPGEAYRALTIRVTPVSQLARSDRVAGAVLRMRYGDDAVRRNGAMAALAAAVSGGPHVALSYAVAFAAAWAGCGAPRHVTSNVLSALDGLARPPLAAACAPGGGPAFVATGEALLIVPRGAAWHEDTPEDPENFVRVPWGALRAAAAASPRLFGALLARTEPLAGAIGGTVDAPDWIGPPGPEEERATDVVFTIVVLDADEGGPRYSVNVRVPRASANWPDSDRILADDDGVTCAVGVRAKGEPVALHPPCRVAWFRVARAPAAAGGYEVRWPTAAAAETTYARYAPEFVAGGRVVFVQRVPRLYGMVGPLVLQQELPLSAAAPPPYEAGSPASSVLMSSALEQFLPPYHAGWCVASRRDHEAVASFLTVFALPFFVPLVRVAFHSSEGEQYVGFRDARGNEQEHVTGLLPGALEIGFDGESFVACDREGILMQWRVRQTETYA
jgi:hypothetical protein